MNMKPQAAVKTDKSYVERGFCLLLYGMIFLNT